ncbi:hypothetical protein DPMN_129657 [Dreissena polymorpha]|uniref:Uncharacterized protein n=1 Tax=Dreissena polymorpha TaxID=45954 RepID=A0A9D4H1K6_DREPO|nr:hypothetical protein DPMN_129657 [Dreissena polymorpha]
MNERPMLGVPRLQLFTSCLRKIKDGELVGLDVDMDRCALRNSRCTHITTTCFKQV